jgi:tetratricopeptide (TPR) repeat protein
VELEQLLQKALDQGEEGDWEGMAAQLLQALEIRPEDPAVLCWLGVAEREMGLSGSAYDRFREALALEPEDPYVLATVGNGLAQFDDPDAEAALRSASVMAPDLPLARWMYGAYLSREGLYAEAMKELEAAAELAPEDPIVTYELGVALALQGNLDAALEAVTRSVDLDRGEGWGLVVMGLLEAELGYWEEAARDLSEGARLRPGDVEIQFLAALAAQVAGWEDLAYEMLERGRQEAQAGDLPLLEAVERRLEEAEGDSRDFLVQELLPGTLRQRLMTRP